MKRILTLLIFVSLLFLCEVRAEESCKNYTTGSYKINFVTFTNDVKVDSITVKFPSDSYATLPIPSREDYIFGGWYYDGTLKNPVEGSSANVVSNPVPLYDDEGCPTGQFEDVTLYAKWTAVSGLEIVGQCEKNDGSRFTVMFDVNGGNAIEEMYVTAATPLEYYVDIPTPTKEGYEFVGWYYNGALSETVGNIKANQLKQNYITYDSETGCEIAKTLLYAKWKKLSEPIENPETGQIYFFIIVLIFFSFIIYIIRNRIGNRIFKL